MTTKTVENGFKDYKNYPYYKDFNNNYSKEKQIHLNNVSISSFILNINRFIFSILFFYYYRGYFSIENTNMRIKLKPIESIINSDILFYKVGLTYFITIFLDTLLFLLISNNNLSKITASLFSFLRKVLNLVLSFISLTIISSLLTQNINCNLNYYFCIFEGTLLLSYYVFYIPALNNLAIKFKIYAQNLLMKSNFPDDE